MELRQLHRAEHGPPRQTGWEMGELTNNRELAEFVLMERPPVDGADVLGANMAMAIGMFKYHAL